MSVKINTALYLQKEMLRFFSTDPGGDYLLGCSEVFVYARPYDQVPQFWWNVETYEASPAMSFAGMSIGMDRVAISRAIQEKLRISTTYWTHADMVKLTLGASLSRPPSAIFNVDLPHMHGFCVFEEPMIIEMATGGVEGEVLGERIARDQQPDIPEGEYKVNVAGFMWNQNSVNGVSGVDVVLFSSPNERQDTMMNFLHTGKRAETFRHTPPLLLLESFFIPFGVDFDDDDVWHAIVATWWHLIMQPLITTSVQNANPQMTKKAKKLDLKPDITVVTLRPRRSPPREDNGNHRIVDWSHRWIVGANEGGFWRNQYYPSLGLTKPLWINAYEKGPKEKPLIIKRAKVYAWRR